MWRTLVVLAACGGNSATPGPGIDAPPGGGDAPEAGDPLAGIGDVELVQEGFQFTEGPQWRDADDTLVFSDIPANTIFSYTPGGVAMVLRMPSGNSNGLALDNAGALLAAEHGTRSVTRDGVAIASMFEGNRLNSPNDVIVGADGSIYFTDPPFGINDNQRELDFIGIFRLSPQGVLTAEHRGALVERPNGIGLSPDGTRLYVADSSDGRLYRYPVAANGTVGARDIHAQTSGTADGLAIDEAGNIFVAAAGGVDVFAPDGSKWGTITTAEQPANVAFGDADHQTLYITSRTTLRRVRLANPGLTRN